MDRTENTKRGFFARLRDRGVFKPFYVTLYVLFGLSLLVYIISRFSSPFAEFWARYPGNGIRYILSLLTTWIPFSLAECLIVLIPLFLFAVIAYTVRACRRKSAESANRIVMTLLSLILFILTTFFSAFAPSYFRYPLTRNIGLTDAPVSGEALYETAVWLAEQLGGVLPDVSFAESGESHLPMTYDGLCGEINDAYANLARDYDVIPSYRSRPKPVALSEYMTYTHISGVYTFFTGEANVNINYPDFILPYTMAHEMAHQRGIAKEDEANFVAFLVCIRSDEPYIVYSGYLNVLREVMSALNKSDKDLYKQFVREYYPGVIVNEMSAYSRFFDKYRESTAAKVVSATNNAYLTSQNVKAGEKSYGLVTDLTVAYYYTNVKNK